MGHRPARLLAWPDRALALVLATRLVPLLAAPVTLYLVATRRPAAEQGFYFVLINVQALSALIELGAGTIVVQFLSHESPGLASGADGALGGDAMAVGRAIGVVRQALRWYLAAGAILLLAVPAGLAAFGSEAHRTGVAFAAAWSIVVAATALYLPLVPLLCTIEGMGGLVRVQRMRLVQTIAGLAALWAGMLTIGALAGVAAMALVWLAVASIWLAATHRGLITQTLRARAAAADARETKLLAVQSRTGLGWLLIWVAPQLLGPLVMAAAGAVEAGRVGMSLAIATAPSTIGSAWLQSRYPQFAETLRTRGRDALDALAGHAARLALLVCLAGGIAASIAVDLLHRYVPSLGARLLPTSAVAALAASGLGWVAIQALTGYLRADREEPLLGYTALGVAVALVIAASAARFGAATTCLAYAAAVLIATVPLVGSGFWRARARHLAASPNGVHLP